MIRLPSPSGWIFAEADIRGISLSAISDGTDLVASRSLPVSPSAHLQSPRWVSDYILCASTGHALIYRSSRYKRDGAKNGSPSRHVGSLDLKGCRAWSCPRIRNRPAIGASIARCGAGSGGIALPGSAPALKPRPPGGGLEGDR